VVVGLAVLPAQAQQAPQAQPRDPVVVESLPIWEQGSAAQVFEIPMNKARAIKLQSPVRDVIVSNEAIADVIVPDTAERSNQVFITARAVGTSNVFLLGADGEVLLQAEIRVTLDASEVQTALDRLMPGEDVKVSAHREGLFLTGTVESAGTSASAAAIVNRFLPEGSTVHNLLNLQGSQQVVLQVRVAEMTRQTVKEFGFDTAFSKSNGGRSLSVDTTGATGLDAGTLFTSGTIVTGIPGLTSTTYQALERQGLTKTLAEPTLTAVSGETATFLAGGEYPFPSGISTDSNQVVTYEFKEFGIRLNFSPTVLDAGRINLHVSTEVSALSTANSITINGTTVNGISARRTETTVDVPSGGSIMISGLLQADDVNAINGVPWFKDVPVLGALFRSVEFNQNKTELVVTVTAYLAKPTDNSAPLALPSDGFVPASDIDLYLLGRLRNTYGKSGTAPPASSLAGPYGYIME